MGVRKKGRRKIICNNKEYIWYIKIGYDDNFDWLHISSNDKNFIVSYRINQIETKKSKHFIIVIGKRFKCVHLATGIWHYIYTPKWNDAVVTPKLVSEIICWCEESGSIEHVSIDDNL